MFSLFLLMSILNLINGGKQSQVCSIPVGKNIAPGKALGWNDYSTIDLCCYRKFLASTHPFYRVLKVTHTSGM
jgi:hypothetical protein